MGKRFSSEWNSRSINRPYITAYWLDAYTVGFHFNWGNTNSDPVWSVGIDTPVPKSWASTLARLIKRWTDG